MESGKASSWKLLEERIYSANSSLADVRSVRWVADKAGLQPVVVAALGMFWICGFLLWGFTGEFVCTVVGLLYPMYGSFKALEGGQHEEVQQWMQYWTTYAALSLSEHVFYRVLAWVPFYHILRILAVLWLFHPSTQGASMVYSWVLAPALRLYSPRIDAALARSAEEVRDTLGSEIVRTTSGVLRKAAVAGAGYMAQQRCASASTPKTHDLGMEDLMIKELSRTASLKPNQAACEKTVAVETPNYSGARARVSSPVPRFSHGVPPPRQFENKENLAS